MIAVTAIISADSHGCITLRTVGYLLSQITSLVIEWNGDETALAIVWLGAGCRLCACHTVECHVVHDSVPVILNCLLDTLLVRVASGGKIQHICLYLILIKFDISANFTVYINESLRV